jgi:hypothetical protein
MSGPLWDLNEQQAWELGSSLLRALPQARSRDAAGVCLDVGELARLLCRDGWRRVRPSQVLSEAADDWERFYRDATGLGPAMQLPADAWGFVAWLRNRARACAAREEA